MALIVNSSGKLEVVTEEEAARRRAGYAAIAADVAGQGSPGLTALRGGGGAGVNLMGGANSVGLTESDLAERGQAGVALAVEQPQVSEDERVARRKAEIQRQLDNLPADETKRSPLDPGPPAPVPASPQLPTTPAQAPGKRVEGGVTTTTRTKIDKKEKEGLDREQAALEEGKKIAGREGELLTKKADSEYATALQQQSAEEGNAAARALKTEEQNKLVQQRKEAFDAELARRDKTFAEATAERSRVKLEKFGETDPAWKVIGRALAAGLGELGRSLLGSGSNTAAEFIQAQAQEHYQLQRQKIEEADKKESRTIAEADRRVGTAREGVTNAKESKIEALADLEADQAAWNKALAAQARTGAASFGTEHAKVMGEKVANEAEERAAQHAQKLGQLLRVQVESRTSWTNTTGADAAGARGGQPTENQTKLALLAQQMKGELDTISKNPQLAQSVLGKMQSGALAAEAADKSAASGLPGAAGVALLRGAGLVPKSKYEKLTDQEQLVANAWDNAVEKYARVLTGAGMPIDEARRLALQDAPHAGDSPVVVAQKFKRMTSFAAQAMSLAGKAAERVAPAAPGAGPPAGSAGPQGSGADQDAINWARAHPNDPRAVRILQLHGM